MKITIDGISFEAADVSLVLMGRSLADLDASEKKLKRFFKKAGGRCARSETYRIAADGGILKPLRFIQDDQP